MTLEAEIIAQGVESWEFKNASAKKAALNHNPVETLTAAGAASIWGVTVMDSTSAAVNLTLANGEQYGQMKTFVMIEASNSSTITVAQHVTSNPEVFTMAAAGDSLVLMWDGTDWSTVANNGAATV